MPVVYVRFENKTPMLVKMVIPRLKPLGCWEWDEIKSVQSKIHGFGVAPKRNKSVNWTDLQNIPVLIPYLGQECECDSAFTCKLFVSVLLGNFDLMRLTDVVKPDDAQWYLDGVCLVSATSTDFEEAPHDYQKEMVLLSEFMKKRQDTYNDDSDNPEVLQVFAKADIKVCVGENSVSYVLKQEMMELLNIPSHLFQLLAMHSENSHIDRHLATHLLKFTRSQKSHVLVNAHPYFKDSAFIMGCVNEPITKGANFKIVTGKVVVLLDDDFLMQKHNVKQHTDALKHWTNFVKEFPDATKVNAYFVSTRNSYKWNDEITAYYGKSYNREYKAFGQTSASKTKQKITTKDVFSSVVKNTARWPDRVPGWFNKDIQPINRRAFQVKDGQILVVADTARQNEHTHNTMWMDVQQFKTTTKITKTFDVSAYKYVLEYQVDSLGKASVPMLFLEGPNSKRIAIPDSNLISRYGTIGTRTLQQVRVVPVKHCIEDYVEHWTLFSVTDQM